MANVPNKCKNTDTKFYAMKQINYLLQKKPPGVGGSPEEGFVLFDDGRIAEQGTHEELMALKGVYARLYQSQFDSVT